MAKISSRGYRKIDPLFRRATWAGVKSAALCATRRSTLQLRKGLRDTKSWDSAQTRVDFLCTNLLESAHLPAVAHWSEMRHTHHQFGPPQFPHSAASSHFSQRAEMKQKGEKRERRQIESGWRAGRPLTLAPLEAQSREGVHQTPPLDQKPSAGRSNYLFLRRARRRLNSQLLCPLSLLPLWFVHWGANAKLCALYAHTAHYSYWNWVKWEWEIRVAI